jgi:G:T-mismatch repair DNA endonuclease (very short patch repair protein)
MWLLHMVQADMVVIKHASSGREYRLPELPHFSVDGNCAETNTIYEFFGCYWHGCTLKPFRDVITYGDTLASRYEQTMARLVQITRAGYQVKVQWECEFDNAGIATPKLFAHQTVCKSPLCTRDALYGGRTEAMRLHYKARKGETIQM